MDAATPIFSLIIPYGILLIQSSVESDALNGENIMIILDLACFVKLS